MNAGVAAAKPAQRRPILDLLFHTAALRVCSMGARAATFALVVRILSPADYGWYALINTTLSLAAFLGTLNFASYLVRELPERSEEMQYGIFRGLIGPMLLTNTVVAALGAVAGRAFLPAVDTHVSGLAALIYMFEITSEQIETFLLGCKQIQKANWVVGARSLAMAVLVSGVALAGGRSLEGILEAMLAAEVLALAVAASSLRWDTLRRAPIPAELWRKALAYSLPLLAAGLAFMAMKFGDKYLIAHYLDLVSVARYAFAYSMANLAYGLTVIVSNVVLVPHVMGAENEDNPSARNRNIVRATKLAIYGLLASAAAYAVIPSRFWVLISGHHDYLGVKGLALALMGTTLLSVLGIPAHLILLAKKRTGVLALIDVSGVCLIAGLNVLLLPRLGLYGATISAAVSFAATSACKHWFVRRQRLFDARELLDWSEERELLTMLVGRGALGWQP